MVTCCEATYFLYLHRLGPGGRLVNIFSFHLCMQNMQNSQNYVHYLDITKQSSTHMEGGLDLPNIPQDSARFHNS